MLQNLLNHVIDHEKVKFIFWLITWIWICIESNCVVVFFQFLLQFKCLKSPLTIDSVGSIVDAPLVNLVNLSTLSERIATYTSIDAFFIDVQWIVHNCIILYTSKNCLDSIFSVGVWKSRLLFHLANHEFSQSAISLHEYFVNEINFMKKCVECYSNLIRYAGSSFVMVCHQPHLIIWAKMKSNIYWPAKLMSIEGEWANVRFFGDHSHNHLKITKCLLYSTANPSKAHKNASIEYNEALKVSKFSF